MQPHEFIALQEGHKWRKERNEDMMAYFVCQLMNIEGKSLKDSIGPAELLKPIRENSEEKKKSDEDYLKEQFRGVLG